MSIKHSNNALLSIGLECCLHIMTLFYNSRNIYMSRNRLKVMKQTSLEIQYGEGSGYSIIGITGAFMFLIRTSYYY